MHLLFQKQEKRDTFFHDETSWISSRYQILVHVACVAVAAAQGFCYCSTHRYRNIGGRFSASLVEKYKNSSACQLPRGFPHWKIEGFPDTATGWKKPTFRYTQDEQFEILWGLMTKRAWEVATDLSFLLCNLTTRWWEFEPHHRPQWNLFWYLVWIYIFISRYLKSSHLYSCFLKIIT